MSWAKWDAEHRSAGVRVTQTAADRHKVTSGGKHLGNIEQKAGMHVAVVKVNGHLQSHAAYTHHGAVNYIRTAHGLPAVSAKKAAAPQVPHVPGMGLVSPKKTAAKKVASPPTAAKKAAAPFHSWNAEHGSGGGGVSSAEQIATSIRGALGPGKMDALKTTSKAGKSGSTISRAEESRSTASHVLKKDMKRPAPVKGEKDPADAFRTKIRMVAYNEKKKQAAASDPVNKHTPQTEVSLNPHATFVKKTDAQSSAGKIAAQIKSVHAEQHGLTKKAAPVTPKDLPPTHSVPALVEHNHAPGGAEDLANKADEATRLAHESPSYVNHQKAYQAHTAVLSSLSGQGHAGTREYKARDYHTMMQGYHRFAADHPGKVIPAKVQQEHKDELADRIPQPAAHQHFSAFTDTASRRHSQQMYEAVPKASESKLTASQKSSIRNYTGSGYLTINAYHRHVVNGSGHLALSDIEYAKKHTANLDAAFNKQPALEHDLVTYRGVRNAETLFGKVGEKVGSEFVDHGYSSTASHAAIVTGFGGAANGTLVRILHPSGSKVLKPSEVGEFNDSEREILTPRGSKFHIAADRLVTLQNGQTQRQIDLVRK